MTTEKEKNTSTIEEAVAEVKNEQPEPERESSGNETRDTDRRVWATVFSPGVTTVTGGRYIYSYEEFTEYAKTHVVMNSIRSATYHKYRADTKNKQAGWAVKNAKFAAGTFVTGPAPMDAHGLPSIATGMPAPDYYSMVGIDLDGIDNETVEKLRQELAGVELIAWHTISSRPDDLRLRVVIPLDKPIKAETRAAVIRFIGKAIGWRGLDPTAIVPKQKQCLRAYCGDTPADDTKLIRQRGQLLDAAAWLVSKDPAYEQNLPLFPAELDTHYRIRRSIHGTGEARPATDEWTPPQDIKDPVERAYCNLHRISEVISECTDRYIKTGVGRYSRAGMNDGCIQVWDDSILYAHCVHDPLATGFPFNAFTLYCKLTNTNPDRAREIFSADADIIKEIATHTEVPAGMHDPREWAIGLAEVTDDSIAEKVAQAWDIVRFNGSFYLYADGIYTKAENATIGRKVTQTIQMLQIYNAADEELAKRKGNATRAKPVVEALAGLLNETKNVTANDWDANGNLLCYKDYMLDIPKLMSIEFPDWEKPETLQAVALPHDPKYLCTKRVACNLADIIGRPIGDNDDKVAYVEVAKQMETILPDRETRDYLFTYLGSSLSGDAYAEQLILFMLGTVGGNGKSTLVNGLISTMGDFYGAGDNRWVYATTQKNGGPDSAKSQLRNCRLVGFTELDKGRPLNIEELKKLSGGVPLTTNNKYESAITWRAKFRLILDCNAMPDFEGWDEGFFRRLRIVPFNQSLRALDLQDPEVMLRWTTDPRIHNALMYLLLMGLQTWWNNGKRCDNGKAAFESGTDMPAEVLEATEGYARAKTSPEEYFAANIIITPYDRATVSSAEAYEDYIQIADGADNSRSSFYQRLATYMKNNREWKRAGGEKLRSRVKGKGGGNTTATVYTHCFLASTNVYA